MKIAIVGLGHTGEIYSACLSELGHTVTGIDKSSDVVKNLNTGIPPLSEPKLSNLLKVHLKKGKLSFTTDIRHIKNSDLIWLTVDTQIGKDAHGSTKQLFSCLRKIIPHLQSGTKLVVSSQLPAGSSAEICDFIRLARKDLSFEYAYVPENLRLGEGVDSFMNASRVVIGTSSDNLKNILSRLFKNITKNIIFVSVPSAEMIKHATNAFLATSMSFIYDISDICEIVGADVTEVSKGLRADGRIGEKAYVDASSGFSGGHLERDLQYLRKIAKKNSITLPVINAVHSKNKQRSEIITRKLFPILGSFKEKTITFFGITYKSGTPTLLHSLPLKVAQRLLSEGAHIKLYDPWVDHTEIEKELPHGSYEYVSDPYDAAKKSDAVICITPWSALKELEFAKLARQMRGAKVFFDARNYFTLQQKALKEAGLNYVGIGR